MASQPMAARLVRRASGPGVQGEPPPGRSTGEAMQVMEDVVSELPAAQRQAQEALARMLEGVSRLSEARYGAGIDGYLGVLVALYKVLGGV